MAVNPETRGAVAPAATRRGSALPALAWAGIVGPVLFTGRSWHRTRYGGTSSVRWPSR